MIKEIVIGIIATLVSSLITFLITKSLLGFKQFNGIKNMVRLNKDCYDSGIINVFASRKVYTQHKDHGTSNEYISKAENSLLYVGYWLAAATEIGEMSDTIIKLVDRQVNVTLVFLSPKDGEGISACSDFVNIESSQVKNRIETAITKMIDLKNTMPPEKQKLFTIKIHNVPLNTTAFIIDSNNSEKCRILLDYKSYKANREESYGIEFQNGNKTITKKVLESYIRISQKAKEVNEISDLK